MKLKIGFLTQRNGPRVTSCVRAESSTRIRQERPITDCDHQVPAVLATRRTAEARSLASDGAKSSGPLENGAQIAAPAPATSSDPAMSSTALFARATKPDEPVFL